MRKTLKIILLALSFSIIPSFFLIGNETKTVIEGYSAYPVINKNGELIFIYRNNDRGLSLATKKIGDNEYNNKEILIGQNASSPVIKKDRKGRIWILWEQEGLERNEIYLSRLEENKILTYEKISRGTLPNFSPDIDFDLQNNPWVTWVQYSDRKFYVLVKSLKSEETWLLNVPFFSGAHSPKITIDGNNMIWVFWVGRNRCRDEIFYTFYDGVQWASPHKLNKDNKFPHILPDAGCGFSGLPWIVWSAFDGNDYEIFYSFWNGSKWSEEERVTNNSATDSYPAISFVFGDVPIIVWSRSYKDRNGIYCRYRNDGKWSREIEISRSKNKLISCPKIAILNNIMGITWQSDDTVQSEFLYFNQLVGESPHTTEIDETKIVLHSSLNGNEYIGFGDSVTYGYLDYQEAPEEGYIPRLEVVLNENYGNSTVINEGWPGEITINGLGRIDDVLSNHSAQYLLLMEGTNDVVFNHISMDTTAFNLEQIVLACKDSGVFPLLSTIIPRNDYRWHYDFYKDRIFYLNEKIRELAVDLVVPLVDQFDIFYNYPEDDGGWISLLCMDNVHPSEKGYEIMAETWFEEIKSLPFPPVNIHVERISDRILFYIRNGNYITWLDNPKLFDKTNFSSYRIYRSKTTGNESEFNFIASIPIKAWNVGFSGINDYGLKYFDVGINLLCNYKYLISLVRDDGIEGPCSEIASDFTQRR